MSNQDGKVVIRIEDNAVKAAANLGKLQDRFATLANDTSKYERILKKVEGTSATNFPVYEKVRQKLEEQQKAIKQATNEFKKLADVQKSGLGYGQLSNLTQSVTDRLRNLALQGRTNTKEFKDLAQTVKTSNKQLQDADNEVRKATQDFGKFQIAGVNVSNALKAISAVAIVKTLSDAGKSAIQTAGEFEQLQTSFKIMAGGAEAGEQLTNSLIDLAAKTPMTTQGLAKATRTLLSFGESSENVIEDLKLLGNISGGEEQRFQSLALAFAQIGSTGRLTGQDLLQMVNQGFNPLQAISEKTGKSMATLKKEMGDGKISFDMVKQAMIDATSEGGRFYGLMEEQSETLNGKLSTLDDTWQLVAKDIGDMLLPATKSAVNGMIKLGEASQNAFKAFNQNTQLKSTTVALAGATTAIVATRTALLTIPPAITAIRTAVTGLNIASLVNPIGLVAAAIGGITYAVIKHNAEIKNAKTSTERYIATLNIETSTAVSQIREYSNLISVKNRTNQQNERLAELTSELTSKYPKYIDKLKEELRVKGEISKATAEQIANEMTLAEVKKLTVQKAEIDKKVAKQQKAYRMNNAISAARFGTPIDVDTSGARKGVKKADQILQDELKKQLEIAQKNKQKIINELTQTTITSGGFSSTGGGESSAEKEAKRIKDAFEKAQEAYQNAQKALKVAIFQYGESSPQARKALETLQKTGAEVKRVEETFNNLTSTSKTNFEQLQQKIQDTQKHLQELASADVVDINAIKNARDELGKLQTKLQDVQNATITSPTQLANAQIQQMQSYLQDRAFTGQWGAAEIAMKNQMVALQNQIKNANTQVTSTIGLDWQNVANSIKSNLSSALLTPLQEGESAFERLGNVAFNIIQMIGQELTEKLFISPLVDNIANSLQGVGNTAQPIQQVSQSLLNTGTAAVQTATATTAMASGQAAVSTAMASSSTAIAGAAATYGAAAASASQLAASITQAAIAQAAYSAALVPIAGAALAPIAATTTGAAIAAGNVMASASNLLSRVTAFENGGAFQNGKVIPFAKGGVVSKPTVFPMANGGTGLMGEAGAEAVMPLRRMSNGRLGVEASNGDNGKAVQVNIFNQSNSQVETRQRDDGSMDIIIKRVNEALMNERTSSGFRAAYQREDRKGLQAV